MAAIFLWVVQKRGICDATGGQKEEVGRTEAPRREFATGRCCQQLSSPVQLCPTCPAPSSKVSRGESRDSTCFAASQEGNCGQDRDEQLTLDQSGPEWTRVDQSGPEWTRPLKLLHEAQGRQRTELSRTVPGTKLGGWSKIRSRYVICYAF